jgi:uncharacterized protein YjbI with pentapeptide repeats
MSPEVIAAIIAAGGVVLTVAATVAVQIAGRRATSRDTQQALEEQRKQLDTTLAVQRARTLNERFATAAGQLGSDKPPEVRLAGLYAMAGLADDWPENRQTCVDVLCAYLRIPYESDPGQDAPDRQRLVFRASREVRHTAIRVIAAHLRNDAAVSWVGLDLDFTGAVLDGGDFAAAQFSGGEISFRDTEFSGDVSFMAAWFSGGRVTFEGAQFSGGTVDFTAARFSGGQVDFTFARFSGARVSFGGVQFGDGLVAFAGAQFSGGQVDFTLAQFSAGTVAFVSAGFSGGTVTFDDAGFFGGRVVFGDAEFSAGSVTFASAGFSGGRVEFSNVEFSGGRVDFSNPRDWSFPPAFSWTGTPPPGVRLPGRIEPALGGPFWSWPPRSGSPCPPSVGAPAAVSSDGMPHL